MMLTAEIKVNGRPVSVVTIQNIAGARGPKLVGKADYEVKRYNIVGGTSHRQAGNNAYVSGWDRSRPAHELVHAAIEAVMEAGK